MKRKSQPAQNSSGLRKRPAFASIKEVCDRRSCLTEEDVQRVVREELDRAESHSAEYCQSCTGNALKEIVQQMHSMEEWMRSAEKQMRSMKISIWELKELVELSVIHSPHLRRDNSQPQSRECGDVSQSQSKAKNDVKTLQLRVLTKLSLPIYTGKKLEGDGDAPISVTLINANTRDVITSGPESSIKLDVVVLEGDFNKQDEDNWAQEEFENYIVKEREGKPPLLIGNLHVTLKGGVGELGELTFTDNSSWTRSKSFRIGLKVAPGYCGNIRIREAKTDAFRVKERRGVAYNKHYPPAPDDEIWRLDKVAKDGKVHQRLNEAGIYNVQHFLRQLYLDPQKLREMLGKTMIPKNWDSLIDHAKTCINYRKHDLCISDGSVFDADGQPIGLIKDRVSHRLSAQEKEHGDKIMKKAFDNCHDVIEFDGETFSGSMQEKSSSSIPSQVLEGQIENLTLVKKSSSSFPYQVHEGQSKNVTAVQESSSSFPCQVLEGQIENLTPVQCSLAPRNCAAPVGPEAPPADVGSTAEVLSPGHNGATALACPVQSQYVNSRNDVEFSVDKNVSVSPHIGP